MKSIRNLKLANKFKSLCTPAQLYLGLSVLTFVGFIIQNCMDPYTLCIGSFTTPSPIHNITYFVIQALYVLFWTWIINKMCTKGWNKLAWLIVLFPVVAMFVLIGMLFLVLTRIDSQEKKN